MKCFRTPRQLLEKYVLPKWEEYLFRKIKETRISGDEISVKDVVIKKKILRDFRQFFRIYFAKRFVSKEFTTNEQKFECVQILLTELGFKFINDKTELLNLFPFFFQVHRPKINNPKFKPTVEFENSPILEVYDRYNSITARRFYSNDI